MKKIDILDKGFVRLIDSYGSDKRIVDTARVSYNSESKGDEQDKKLLFYLYKHRHTSPFEQCSITFHIKLPLFVQGQMVRHRTQKLNQISSRYTQMTDDFYIPTTWRRQDTKNKQGSYEEEGFDPRIFLGLDWETKERASTITEFFCQRAYSLYEEMIEAGIAKEMARIILPQNLYTEIRSTWDLHNLMHFLTLRMDSHAQWEIQQYANAMYSIAKDLFPWTFEAFDKYKFKIIEDKCNE